MQVYINYIRLNERVGVMSWEGSSDGTVFSTDAFDIDVSADGVLWFHLGIGRCAKGCVPCHAVPNVTSLCAAS
jgi:hypothetical protein